MARNLAFLRMVRRSVSSARRFESFHCQQGAPVRGKHCLAGCRRRPGILVVVDSLSAHSILLGQCTHRFAGLRIAEVSGLRVCDVDFMRGVVFPHVQWPDKPLKTPGSEAPIPVPPELTLLFSASVQKYPSDWMVTNGHGTDRCGPWIIERAFREAKKQVAGLPEGFCFHDLRHYFASLLINKREDVKTVQARLRHASATTTLDVYGHLWPDADEATRSVIGAVIAERMAPVELTAD